MPVLTLIQQIKAKQLSPATLSAEDRRRCVEVLRAEGYNQGEIALILQRNEKTIRRDLEAIRAQYALAPDPHLAERMVGQLVREADTSASHLRRLARDTNASVMERAMAESFAWKTVRECFEKLQSVGYLPRVTPTVTALSQSRCYLLFRESISFLPAQPTHTDRILPVYQILN